MTEMTKTNTLVNSKYCRDCGATIAASARTCPHCGGNQGGGLGGDGTKSRIVAAILAFVLGGIGGHKFYLGRVGQGILYLLFCWTFIPAIIAFIEMIVYLTMSDEDFAKKYG